MRKFIYVMFTLLLSGVLFSCSDKIEGVGPIVTQDLDVQEIESIDLDASFDIEIYYGEEQKVRAIGNQNIIDRIDTWVKAKHWSIGLRDGNYSNFSLKLEITIPKLTKAIVHGSGDIRIESAKSDNLELIIKGSGDLYVPALITTPNRAKLLVNGSGDINVNNIETEELNTVINGSGDIAIAGQTNSHTITIDGSGNLMAFDLSCKNCNISVDGSGNTSISVEDKLDVAIKGSGDVIYKGDPTVSVDIDGSGRIRKVN